MVGKKKTKYGSGEDNLQTGAVASWSFYEAAPSTPYESHKVFTGKIAPAIYFGGKPDSTNEILREYKTYFRSPQSKLSAIKRGLSSKALLDLMEVTGTTRMAVAQLLDLTEPTLRKYINAGQGLNIGLSEHILQLFELFDKGMDTFGSLEEFKSWLPKHNIGINDKPIDLLDTITGINIVMNELLRIDHGVLA